MSLNSFQTNLTATSRLEEAVVEEEVKTAMTKGRTSRSNAAGVEEVVGVATACPTESILRTSVNRLMQRETKEQDGVAAAVEEPEETIMVNATASLGQQPRASERTTVASSSSRKRENAKPMTSTLESCRKETISKLPTPSTLPNKVPLRWVVARTTLARESVITKTWEELPSISMVMIIASYKARRRSNLFAKVATVTRRTKSR